MFDVLIFSPFFPGLSSCSCFFLPGLPLFFCLRHHLESAPLLLDVAARLIQKSRHCFPKAGFLHAAAVISVHGLAEKQKNRPELNVQDGI